MRATLVKFLLLLGIVSSAWAQPPSHQAAVIRSTTAEGELADAGEFYRYRLNTAMGMHIIGSTSAFMISGQFGVAPFGTHPFFVGPDMSFALFSGGSLFGVWASGWYEMKLSGAPRLSLLFGAVGGPTFTSHVSPLPTTSYSAFLDLGVTEEIDDLASIRIQLRPGIEGGYFAFLAGLMISFHFL